MRAQKGYLLLIAIGILLVVSGCQRRPSGPQLRVEDAWARPAEMGTMAGKSMTAVYFTVVNEGNEADRLVRVESDIAATAEIHQTTFEDNIARMKPVREGVRIPAAGQATFSPGGYHVMLVGLRQPLRSGDRFTLTLYFEKSPPITVEVDVR